MIGGWNAKALFVGLVRLPRINDCVLAEGCGGRV
jgi:hypothetical protein